MSYILSSVTVANHSSFTLGFDSRQGLGLPSKSHHENQTACIFLQSPHQLDMKNYVKCCKDFLLYLTTLETYRANVPKLKSS